VPTVFVVDDEESIQTLVVYNFQRAGFAVETASNGRTAYEMIRDNAANYDIVILDWMLPDMDGMEVCKRLRSDQVTTPIILLTARDDEVDLVLGLEMGADDYVTKPFSPRELVARARAVLRRFEANVEISAETVTATTATHSIATNRILQLGEVVMDLLRHEVTVRGQAIELTPKEFDLLRYLLENREHVLSRDQLLDHVWGYTVATDTRIVDVHVSHLRDKIEADAKNPVYIRTVRGIGYKFINGLGH